MARDPIVIWGVVSSLLLALSIVAVALRLYTGHYTARGLKAPDYLICLALICQIGYVADISVGAYDGGLGHRIIDLLATPTKIVTTLKVFWISQWFWATGVASFRVAILLLYMEVFSIGSFPLRAKATAGIVIAYWAACILTICLLCKPVSWNWDQSTPGSCGNITAIEIFSGAFNMTVDIWVVYLPLPTIWKLQLTPQRKWALTAAFSLGLGTAGVNLGRLIQTVRCKNDTTYCLLESTILVTAEITGGILVACIPTLGPLLARHKQGSSSHSYPSQGQKHLVTFGSIPLRSSKTRTGTVDSSMAGRDEEWARLDDENSESNLNLPPQGTGNMTGVSPNWRSSHDRPEAEARQDKVPAGAIMRKVEYGVDEGRV